VCGGTPLSRILLPVFRRDVLSWMVSWFHVFPSLVRVCVVCVCMYIVIYIYIYLILNRHQKLGLNNDIFECTDHTGYIIQCNNLREPPYVPHAGASSRIMLLNLQEIMD
jgi:hypothetical protein